MRAIVAIVLALWLPLQSAATTVPKRSLGEVVSDSDHVVIAQVVKVDMVDENGNAVLDRKAKTGPGLKNQIRLHLQVREVLFTRSRDFPSEVRVGLWQAWHYSLGQIQDATNGATSIFLLKGSDFSPAYPAFFQRDLSEKEEILRLIDQRLRTR